MCAFFLIVPIDDHTNNFCLYTHLCSPGTVLPCLLLLIIAMLVVFYVQQQASLDTLLGCIRSELLQAETDNHCQALPRERSEQSFGGIRRI